MDVEQIKQRQRESWGQGDYTQLSRTLRPAAVALCDACAVSAGQEVLDVAAGDGNFALACAREGASVVASDLSPAMVERGLARSEAEGYKIEWVEADAEALPFDDGRFDCAGSVFGAMIAPRPELVARELFRVVRSGGTVGMVAWTPGSFPAEVFAVARRYLPPPAGMPVSEEWGSEDTVGERLDGLAASLAMERRTLAWEAESPEAFAEELATNAPMQAAARRTLPPERFEEMRRENVELARRRGGEGPLRIESEYLLTVARKRG